MKILVASALFALSLGARAQSADAVNDVPPNEPPYTSLEDEFDAQNAAADSVTELRAGGEPAEEHAAVAEPGSSAAAETVPARSATPEPVIVDREPGKTYIRHPGAKDGLYLIDRDGSYYYHTERQSKREQTSTVRIGGLTPGPSIISADGTTSYQQMYGSATPVVIQYDYDWMPLKGFGALGLQGGVGFFTAQGSGRFVDPNTAATYTEGALEKYTFYAIPISLGVIYRFQLSDRQWVVPYVAGGGTYYALAEFRDDGKTPNFVGTPSVYGAGGLMFNVSAIYPETGFRLDSEYGINTLWMTLEGRQIQATNPDLDLGGTLISFGVSVDY